MKKMIVGFLLGAVLFGGAGVAYAAVKTTDNDVKISQTRKGESVIGDARYTDYFTNESGKEREFTAYEFEWRGRICLLIDEVGSEGGQTMTCPLEGEGSP